jgi:hypothetical protein
MEEVELQRGIDGYERHLLAMTETFNGGAAERQLPVRMDPTNAIAAVKAGVGLARVSPFWRSRVDDTGVVHESQLRTAIDCLVELLDPEKRCGHVVGAMQSGKTTTSLALQWAGPVLYLMKGQRAYPFYIIGNQTNHEDQTKTELDRFLSFYGNVELKLVAGTARGPDGDAMFDRSPSLLTYREHVLRDAMKDFYEIPQLGDIVHRRVGGSGGLARIGELCKRATDQGYRPLMIIDEPQFGASDRFVEGDAGPERRKCVLEQIFERIEQEIGATRNDHWFVGLSATPFELNDLSRIWEVRQCLTAAYSGFNFFNGREISAGVSITPPTTMGLTDFGTSIGVPFLARLSLAAYDKETAFARHAERIGYEEDQASYQAAVEGALRDTIYALLDRYRDDPKWPIGLCIRAFNDNAKTDALLARISLDPGRVEIIRYYGTNAGSFSVKRAISRRAHPELPYIVFVTNRARMADAFPIEVRFFMDLAQKASDLNALLQGLLGRACGYSKASTVVLSDANAEIVDAYVATNGGYVARTSRHSVTVGGFRRGAPTGVLKLRVEMDDPVVCEFFRRIDQQVVEPNIKPGATLKVPRAKGAGAVRTGPILLAAESVGLFDHIEQASVRTQLFPQIPTGFRVARRNEAIRHSHQPGIMLSYGLDAAGNCRFTFRRAGRMDAAKGGAPGRAKGRKDVGQHMEPTIYIEKYDPESNAVLVDDTTPGRWRAFMVTFPLRDPVREVKAAEVAYPVPHSPYNDLMTDGERQTRDEPQRQGRAAGA